MEPAVFSLPKIGTTLANRYLLKRVIGRGGMGVVFEAENTRINQRVAIKMLLPHSAESSESIERFHREARAAGQLRSSHVARVFDSDVTADGLPYMVLEFLEGSDLSALAKERGKLPYAEAADFVLQACLGMAEAHRAGIVHRDLKLSNLFLSMEDGRQTIKVLDFGISKILENDSDESHLTATMTMVGTPHFMAPEQIHNSHGVDGRADVWSLGVILYRLLTGRFPFEGNTLSVAAAILSGTAIPVRRICTDVPDELSFAVSRALRRDPELRFQTVQALARALMPFAEGAEAHLSHPSLLVVALTEASANEVLVDAADEARPGPEDELDSFAPLRLPYPHMASDASREIMARSTRDEEETRVGASDFSLRAAVPADIGSEASRAVVLESRPLDDETRVAPMAEIDAAMEEPIHVAALGASPSRARRWAMGGVALAIVAAGAIAWTRTASPTTAAPVLATGSQPVAEEARPLDPPPPPAPPPPIASAVASAPSIEPASPSPPHVRQVAAAPSVAHHPAPTLPARSEPTPTPPSPRPASTAVRGGDEHVLHL